MISLQWHQEQLWGYVEEGGTHVRISFWHLLMNFEKPKKSEFWKNRKKKKIAGDIINLHMCTKNPQSGRVPEM